MSKKLIMAIRKRYLFSEKKPAFNCFMFLLKFEYLKLIKLIFIFAEMVPLWISFTSLNDPLKKQLKIIYEKNNILKKLV